MSFNHHAVTRYQRTISLEDYYKRKTIFIPHSYEVTCNKCGGSGYDDSYLENDSKSEVKMHKIKFSEYYEISINKLVEPPKELCASCQGEGILIKTENLHITIPETPDDMQILNQYNIIIDLKIREHQKYYIEEKTDVNLCLIKPIPINLNNALCGGGFTFYHLSDTLQIQPNLKVIKLNELYKIPHKGLFHRGSENRGDLLVKFKIIMPSKLTHETIKTIYKLLPPNDEIKG
eukprot:980947_1